MSRRTPIAVVLMAAVLLAFSAAAKPVRLWVVQPTVSDLRPPGGAPVETVDSPTRPEEESEAGGGLGPLPQLLAVLVTAAGGAALIAMRGWWPQAWPLGGVRARRRHRFGVLPEVPDDSRGLGVEGARAALTTGQPRNAIVACWMQLESEVAASGRPRSGAETSAEYVERIVAEMSVDPSAISDLAALYREARFSDHALVDADRADALAALSRVEADLWSGGEVPA
jgi:hypothetical protein